ncbi:hypothetical protein [Streptomyces tanashiensis]|uniref:Uncharacterized protein n=1 Tax=Streptomyces tanashiensis TaxID=67367 RepID=A0ABY6QRH8_9ACTN|nr:hypothetical protein [Streptomyces tanashiensis]UZX19849.1 hypothetical protein LDH80_03535 [Streptomyces tanashiensis]
MGVGYLSVEQLTHVELRRPLGSGLPRQRSVRVDPDLAGCGDVFAVSVDDEENRGRGDLDVMREDSIEVDPTGRPLTAGTEISQDQRPTISLMRRSRKGCDERVIGELIWWMPGV